VGAAPSVAGRRGEHFLAVILAALNALEQGIVGCEGDFASAANEREQRTVILAMRRINHDVMGLHEVTPWVESARGSTLGLGLVYFVDEMVAALLKDSADVVMTPSGTYMYSTLHKPFEALLIDLGVAYPAAVSPIIVAYPVHEPASLFLHLLIAHEVGHSAIAEHHLDQEVYRLDPNGSATKAILSQAVTEYVNSEGGNRAAATGKLRVMLTRWLREIVCDSLALGFLGPSYLFASAAFSPPFGGPEPSDTHPPFTLRTRLLLEQLTSWGWRRSIEKRVPATVRWLDATAARPQQAGHRTYFLRLEEAILNLASTIEEVVRTHLKSDRFAPEAYSPFADELSGLLERDILPAQLLDRRAPAARAIVLAGWFHAFGKRGDDPVALAEIVADRQQQRFLTKALEMSVVLERWRALP
jgi:hypothetical protein